MSKPLRDRLTIVFQDPADLAEIEAAAREARLSTSSWVRTTILAVLRQQKSQNADRG